MCVDFILYVLLRFLWRFTSQGVLTYQKAKYHLKTSFQARSYPDGRNATSGGKGWEKLPSVPLQNFLQIHLLPCVGSSSVEEIRGLASILLQSPRSTCILEDPL